MELAEAVLESPLFRLALDVIDGDDHRHGRATELASVVLEACAGPVGLDGGTEARDEAVGAGEGAAEATTIHAEVQRP